MAVAAVDFFVGKIVSLLENEASLLGGVHDELNEMKLELESMRAFLVDAERKRALTAGEETWVASVRDIAYDVEDIIDEYVYHMNKPQGEGKFARFIYQTIRLPKNLWVKHQIATKLQKFNTRIKAIPERHQRYGVGSIEGTSSRDDHNRAQKLGESSFFLSDDDVVGIEDDKELLTGWLTDEEPQRTVISVVGMGGSGKTTLVAKAYKSQKVKRHFHCYAWITVFQTYVIEDLFRNIIKEFYQATKELIPSDLSTMNYKQLVEMLVNYLEMKRYVVVLDDVWNINLWTEIKVSLPDGRHGSRILLTTRKEDIATFSFGVGSHVHHIRPLGKDEAWNLFCRKAFSSNPNRCCPRELESLGKDLVGKCEGLPIAIVALGGLMSSKKLEGEWREVHNSLNWELSNNPMLEVVKSRILLLSFNDLPYQLKQCFLYCCAFPEYFLIRRKRLIRLWMAEGFIEVRRGKTPEEVAESYLMELIRRSMLQVVRRNSFGRPKECKMHDVMRELALSISVREKFCNVYDGREGTTESKAHRLSIQIGAERMKLPADMSRLRSFFVFINDFLDVPYGFRLLRVLDMEDTGIDKLPHGLENLFNLRYLNLRNTRVKKLPKSIGRLQNLQTLDISVTLIEALPSGIVKLQKLQYLIMECGNFSIRAPSNICKLKNLQVLKGVKAEGDIIRQVKNMTQLTNFGITGVREVDAMDLCTSIQEMNLLCYLTVVGTKENQEVLRMDALSSPPPNLRKLILDGILERVPHWFNSLQNLTSLVLQNSRLGEDPLPYIQVLPNLVFLGLFNAYEGKQLCFCAGFKKLEDLKICGFHLLNEIIIEKGVMPGLQILDLMDCAELKTIPQGIEYLIGLQDMFLHFVSKELIERILGEESMDRPKVRHIPNIKYSKGNLS